MEKLFEQEVPEIYDGIIEIKACARDPGSRAKIAVISKDSSIDPVGACVGMRGSRVQAVVQELGGEKVDIIPWSPDPATFVVNALAPAEVSKVVLDPDAKRIEVIVPDQQQHIAIGRRGQNVRLASQLTGWDIDIVSDTEDRERRQREFRELTEMFMDSLNVEEVIAQLLVTEGFATVQDVAYTETEELAGIAGFDEEIAEALKERAQAYLDEVEQNLRAEAAELGLAEDLLGYDGLPLATIVELGRKGVKTLEDLADLAGDELVELVPDAGLERRRRRCDHHGRAGAARLDRGAPGRGRAGRRRRRSRINGNGMEQTAWATRCWSSRPAARGRAPAAASPRAHRGPADGMIRFVRRARGRSWSPIWLRGCRAAACGSAPTASALAQALARNQFARAARAPVGAPADLVEQVGAMLLRRCLDLVGLARRAGDLVAGFDQVADGAAARPLRAGARARATVPPRPAADRGAGARRAGARPVRPHASWAALSAATRSSMSASPPAGSPEQLLKELGRLHGFREFAHARWACRSQQRRR